MDVRLADTDESMEISTLEVTVAEDRESFSVTVTRPTSEFDGDDAPGTPIGYFEVESTAPVQTATFTFEADADDPEEVTLLRWDETTWREYETTHDDAEGVYRAETAGFSRFAVAAVQGGGIDVVDASVPADRVQSGSSTTVVTTVENPGNRPATRSLTVTVNGEAVATEDVSLEAGERADVVIPFEPPESGSVAVEGIDAGSIATSGAAATSTPTPSDGDGAGFTAVSTVILVLLVAILARRRT